MLARTRMGYERNLLVLVQKADSEMNFLSGSSVPAVQKKGV